MCWAVGGKQNIGKTYIFEYRSDDLGYVKVCVSEERFIEEWGEQLMNVYSDILNTHLLKSVWLGNLKQ